MQVPLRLHRLQIQANCPHLVPGALAHQQPTHTHPKGEEGKKNRAGPYLVLGTRAHEQPSHAHPSKGKKKEHKKEQNASHLVLGTLAHQQERVVGRQGRAGDQLGGPGKGGRIDGLGRGDLAPGGRVVGCAAGTAGTGWGGGDLTVRAATLGRAATSWSGCYLKQRTPWRSNRKQACVLQRSLHCTAHRGAARLARADTQSCHAAPSLATHRCAAGAALTHVQVAGKGWAALAGCPPLARYPSPSPWAKVRFFFLLCLLQGLPTPHQFPRPNCFSRVSCYAYAMLQRSPTYRYTPASVAFSGSLRSSLAAVRVKELL